MWEDKGPSFSKMSRDQYFNAGERELSKPNYVEVEEGPVDEVSIKVRYFVEKLFNNQEISETIMSYLLNGGQRLSKFYHLLKTHKIPLDVSDPSSWLESHGFPVRGIISGVGSPTERLAGFVDFFLQPGMTSLSSYLRDTKHTLQCIEEVNMKVDKGEINLDNVNLVSLDIVSMYSNMSDDLGISACTEYLNTRNFSDMNEEMQISTSNIIDALKLCIKNNYFECNGKIHKIIGGVGTGIKLAPPYACIGMGKYEKLVFESENDLVSLVLFWKRFIDDIFMLFRGSHEQCANLVTWLNSLMPENIQFTFDFSKEKIQFLDVEIFKENGKLLTNLYIKPSNLQLFLDFSSNHPFHTKRSIIYGQALRIIERCSKISDVEFHLTKLKSKLLARNYPEKMIEDQFSRAKKCS